MNVLAENEQLMYTHTCTRTPTDTHTSFNGGSYVSVVAKTEDEFSVYFEIQDSRHFRNVTFIFSIFCFLSLWLFFFFFPFFSFCFCFCFLFCCCLFCFCFWSHTCLYLCIYFSRHITSLSAALITYFVFICYFFNLYGGLGWVPNEVEDKVHVKICVPVTAHVRLCIGYIYIYIRPRRPWQSRSMGDNVE